MLAEGPPMPQPPIEVPIAPAQPVPSGEAAPPSPENPRQILNSAWGGGLGLVMEVYEIDPKIVATKLNKPVTDATYDATQDADVQTEIKRRQEALDKKPELKTALEVIKKAQDCKQAADAAVAAAKAKAKPGETVDEAAIKAQYYTGTGVYYEVGTDGQPKEPTTADGKKAKVEINLSTIVKPIMTELRELAKETESTAPDQPTKLTERAKQAAEKLAILEKCLTPDSTHFNPDKLKPPEAEHISNIDKEAERALQEITFAQTHDETGNPLTEEQLKAIPKSEVLYNIEVLLDTLPRAQGNYQDFVRTGIYSQLNILYEDPASPLPPETRTQLGEFLQNASLQLEVGKGQTELSENVVAPILAKVDPEWRTTCKELAVDPDKSFSVLLIATRLKGKSVEEIGKVINSLRGSGLTFTAAEETLIKACAMKGAPSLATFEANLQAMGFKNIDEIGKPKEWVKKHARGIAEKIIPTVAQDADDAIKQERAARVDSATRAIQQHGDIDPVKVKEKLLKKLFNPKLLYSIGGAAMILSMFQNTLGFGVIMGGEEEQAQR